MGFTKVHILFCLLLICSSVTAIQNPIFLDENFESGFIDIGSSSDLYYVIFESRSEPSTDPLLLWLNGGPGCSSLIGLFYENGPYKVTNDTTLESNPFSWNNKANLLYVDQPVGTGFSHAGLFDLVSTERGVSRDFYEFLTKFFALFPQYVGRDFYISGESYAGQYIPAIASKILDEANPIINLKGIAIGNGWIDPYYQQPAYAEYAYAYNLISEKTYKSTLKQFEFCQFLLKIHSPAILASLPCSIPYQEIVGNPPRFNYYDILAPCQGDGCYEAEDEKVEKFLARKDVQNILKTGTKQWKPCVNNVSFALSGQENRSAIKQLVQALDSKIKVLIYSGVQDFICNYMGAEQWAYHLQWSGQSQFQQTEYSEWSYKGIPLGQKKVVDNLSFLLVNGAGHQVPMDTPMSALVLIEQFLYSSFNDDEQAE